MWIQIYRLLVNFNSKNMTASLKGKQGEERAIQYLEQCGYTLLARNYRCGRSEIDLIARHEDTIIFIEVKFRTNAGFGWPEEMVSPAQQERIVRAAETYLLQHNFHNHIRFDIISILGNQIEHFQDAFY